MILKNLQLLKKSMEENGWCIDSFLFNYNKSNYIVLVKLYDPKEERPQYALLKLEFLKQDDIQNKLLTLTWVNDIIKLTSVGRPTYAMKGSI